MRTILCIENAPSLEDCYYVNAFLRRWEGAVIDFSGFKMKSKEEIFSAVTKCTDIICQTALANGSEHQFDSMLTLLSKIKDSKNIYLRLLGEDLFEYMDNHFSDEELLSIRHHNLYELNEYADLEKIDAKEIRFDVRLDAFVKRQNELSKYLSEGKTRITGRKVKVLACNGCGKAFQNLPIGQTVDEIDMSKTDPSTRGVWIWGNGEPIKLINDCGLTEYQLLQATAFEVGIEVIKLVGLKPEDITDIVKNGISSLIEDDEYSALDKANIICEDLGVPKRGNRERIRKILEPVEA